MFILCAQEKSYAEISKLCIKQTCSRASVDEPLENRGTLYLSVELCFGSSTTVGFDRAFQAAATFASPAELDAFRKRIDPAWIDATLAASGRKRCLPSERVILIVGGMGLFALARSTS
jgi:hypothetical protein